jgi:hypothetical protein
LDEKDLTIDEDKDDEIAENNIPSDQCNVAINYVKVGLSSAASKACAMGTKRRHYIGLTNQREIAPASAHDSQMTFEFEELVHTAWNRNKLGIMAIGLNDEVVG